MSEPLVASGSRAMVRERFLTVDVANVADVLDELGCHGQVIDSRFAALAGDRIAGWAFTLQGTHEQVAHGKDALKAEACSQVGPGEVTVWAGGGGSTCFLGELIAVGLQERGCVGALVHGGARDLRWIRHHGFPLFGTARSPVQSAGRWSVKAYQVEVALPGQSGYPVVVRPGDFVVGDDDGVLVVPEQLVETVLDRAEQLTEHERVIRADLAAGMSLEDCLERHGKL